MEIMKITFKIERFGVPSFLMTPAQTQIYNNLLQTKQGIMKELFDLLTIDNEI